LSSGAHVVVNYAGSKDAAEAVAKEIEGMGVKAMAIKVKIPSSPSSRSPSPRSRHPFPAAYAGKRTGDRAPSL
jgi:hypothetical protein